MTQQKDRMMVTLEPEWKDELDRLKKEVFYDKPKSAMVRHIMAKGLKAIKAEADKPA